MLPGCIITSSKTHINKWHMCPGSYNKNPEEEEEEDEEKEDDWEQARLERMW